MSSIKTTFRNFKSDIKSIELPQKFTYPFFYEPHPISVLAAEELQAELLKNNFIRPLFDDDSNTCLPAGKMFGVLVVQNTCGNIGYLAGFSGKLGDKGHLDGFVPPVFDLWDKEGFFIAEETVLNQINDDIEELEKDMVFIELQKTLIQFRKESEHEIHAKKDNLKFLKNERKQQREKASSQLNEEDFESLNNDLIKQSLRDKYELRKLTTEWQEKIDLIESEIQTFKQRIEALKKSRKEKSNNLQNKLFQHYRFLNIEGIEKDLIDIFKNTLLQKPPAAAGDCAAPKLLQYAFKNELNPIAMAEFWWGKAPKSEIRKHQHFYPACRGKCEPILGHMLSGMDVDDNPLLINPALNIELGIIYEDEDIVIVNKPAEFLSVPGISIQDSVYERMRLRYPKATGPLIVHRLDMSTSGLLVLAKNKESHKAIQNQFIKKTVKKRYVALLDGIINAEKGVIDLPLRVDLDDRPRQLVCYEFGKPATTEWNVVKRTSTHTKVHFYPITGRTHQLRVHASHPLGLNVPITGDDLYGTKANRLHLHAESLSFKHPKTNEWMHFQIKEDF